MFEQGVFEVGFGSIEVLFCLSSVMVLFYFVRVRRVRGFYLTLIFI